MSNDYVTVEVKGMDELQRRFEELPFKVAKAGLRQALAAGSNVIVSIMVALVPRNLKDLRWPPGFLAQKINARIHIDNGQLSGTSSIGPRGNVDYPYYPKSGAYKIIRKKNGRVKKVGKIAVRSVASWFEFGTTKIKPLAFMTRAFSQGKDQALEKITTALRNALDESTR